MEEMVALMEIANGRPPITALGTLQQIHAKAVRHVCEKHEKLVLALAAPRKQSDRRAEWEAAGWEIPKAPPSPTNKAQDKSTPSLSPEKNPPKGKAAKAAGGNKQKGGNKNM